MASRCPQLLRALALPSISGAPVPTSSSRWGPTLQSASRHRAGGPGLQVGLRGLESDQESSLRQVRRGPSPGSGQVPRAETGLELKPKASGMESPGGMWGGKDGRHPLMSHSPG